MRVLHVTSMYPSKDKPATGTFVKAQIDSLRSQVDIDLFILPGFQGIKAYFKSIPDLKKKLAQSYDIIHVHYGNASTFIKFFNRGNSKLITSYCGDDLLGTTSASFKSRLKGYLFKKLNIYFSRFDDVSITKSENLAQIIRSKVDRLLIVPNGIDNSKFYPRDKNECRKILGLENEKRKIILFPASIEDANKNFLLLEKAVRKIDSKLFTIVHFGKKNVAHDQVPLYLNAADLIAYTAIQEGSPNIVKEAMACNCTIFSTPCGDAAWLLEGIENAKIIAWNEQAWFDNINSFVINELSLTPGNAKLVFQEKQLDIQSIAKRIVSIYKQILAS